MKNLGCISLLAQILVRIVTLLLALKGHMPSVYYTTDGKIIFGMPEAKRNERNRG